MKLAHDPVDATGDANGDAEPLLRELTRRQFANPRERLDFALRCACARGSVPVEAAAQALGWLRLEPGSALGRLRRTELIQLTQAMCRFRRRGAAVDTPAPAFR